jgi:putative transposase
MGGRKLHHELQKPLATLGISRGRDALFDLLAARNLLVPTKRSRHKTTWSGLWRCPNLLADLTVTHVHHVWVGDITYIATEEGFVYLALLTDVFSRFIVGFDLSSSLAVEGCTRALEQALAQAGGVDLSGLIHHSDHGVQYTATSYRECLKRKHIRSSMGEVGNCYENDYDSCCTSMERFDMTSRGRGRELSLHPCCLVGTASPVGSSYRYSGFSE